MYGTPPAPSNHTVGKRVVPQGPHRLAPSIQPLFANSAQRRRCLRGDSGQCRLLCLSLPPLLGQGRDIGLPPSSPPPHPHHPNYAMRLLSLSLFDLDLPSPGCRIPRGHPWPVPPRLPGPSRGRFLWGASLDSRMGVPTRARAEVHAGCPCQPVLSSSLLRGLEW